MQVPIACRLTTVAARSQLDEWRDLLADATVATERTSGCELTFRLTDDLVRLDAVVRLAQREKACCPFFDFALLIDADRVVLRISVPPDATAILDGFAPGSG